MERIVEGQMSCTSFPQSHKVTLYGFFSVGKWRSTKPVFKLTKSARGVEEKGKKNVDNGMIRTCAGEPNRFLICLLNHSDTLSVMLTGSPQYPQRARSTHVIEITVLSVQPFRARNPSVNLVFTRSKQRHIWLLI